MNIEEYKKMFGYKKCTIDSSQFELMHQYINKYLDNERNSALLQTNGIRSYKIYDAYCKEFKHPVGSNIFFRYLKTFGLMKIRKNKVWHYCYNEESNEI